MFMCLLEFVIIFFFHLAIYLLIFWMNKGAIKSFNFMK